MVMHPWSLSECSLYKKKKNKPIFISWFLDPHTSLRWSFLVKFWGSFMCNIISPANRVNMTPLSIWFLSPALLLQLMLLVLYRLGMERVKSPVSFLILTWLLQIYFHLGWFSLWVSHTQHFLYWALFPPALFSTELLPCGWVGFCQRLFMYYCGNHMIFVFR